MVCAATLPRNILVRAQQAVFAYRAGPVVLRAVTLDVAAGEVAMVLGKSGSGKTTLLRLLAGLAKPQQGHILFPSANGSGAPRIAYIPQSLGLVRSRTALQNVLTGALCRSRYSASLLGFFSRPLVAQARQWLSRLGIADKADVPVFSLSGGERQRVAIARALMAQPKVVLADEFVSQLDAVTTRDILKMMRELAQAEGVAWLVTTHETDLAVKYADRIAVMAEGKLVVEAAACALPERVILEWLGS